MERHGRTRLVFCFDRTWNKLPVDTRRLRAACSGQRRLEHAASGYADVAFLLDAAASVAAFGHGAVRKNKRPTIVGA